MGGMGVAISISIICVVNSLGSFGNFCVSASARSLCRILRRCLIERSAKLVLVANQHSHMSLGSASGPADPTAHETPSSLLDRIMSPGEKVSSMCGMGVAMSISIIRGVSSEPLGSFGNF